MSHVTHRKSHLSAGKYIRKNLGSVIGEALMQLLVRVAALLPLGLKLAGVDALSKVSTIIAALASAVLYVFLVLPLRSRAFRAVSVKVGGYKAVAYGTHLAASLRRVALGLLWGVPFIAATGLWFYAFNGMDMPTFFAILSGLGGIVGGRFDAGIVIWVGGIIVFALLFAYGWWYSLCKDYVPLHKGVNHAFKRAKVIRRRNGNVFRRAALLNMLLTLPSLIVMAIVLGMHFMGSIKLSMGAMAAAQQLMKIISGGLTAETVLYLAAALVVVHLPLCVVRKVRNAVMVLKLYQGSEQA